MVLDAWGQRLTTRSLAANVCADEDVPDPRQAALEVVSKGPDSSTDADDIKLLRNHGIYPAKCCLV
jgi:hypothetical protein